MKRSNRKADYPNWYSTNWGGSRAGSGRKVKSPAQGKTKVTSISLPESTLKDLTRIAKKIGMSKSELVTIALDAQLASFEAGRPMEQRNIDGGIDLVPDKVKKS